MVHLREYRPASAAFLLMMAMSLTTTGLSFFVGPVCAELGFGRGAFTVYYSILTAAGTLASPFLGQLIQGRGVRTVAVVSALWGAAGLLGFSLCRFLWMFYLTGAFLGLFATACVSLCAGIIVQTSYHIERASRLTGIVMAGSGVGGMLVSLLLPGLIARLGWRAGYRLTALVWLILGLSAAWLLAGSAQISGAGEGQGGSRGMTRREALGSGRLYLLILVIFLLSAASGVQQQLPSVLDEAGLDTARVGGAMSFFTGMLALGKTLQGLLYGKVGPGRGGGAMVLVYMAGFALLAGGHVWPGLLALAAGMGTVTTLMPIVTRAVFGGREYAAIWSILSAVSNLGAMAAAPLFALAFDRTRSYEGAMAAAAVLLLPALAALMAALRKGADSGWR